MTTRPFYPHDQISQMLQRGVRIFGSPSASSLAPTSSASESEKGRFGEAIIGNILNLMAVEHPDFYVFHSVGLPSNLAGETDHVVIYKNRIFVIETKTYSRYAHYLVTKDGELYAQTATSKKAKQINDNYIFQKADVYRDWFPQDYVVQSVVVITRDDIETVSENGKYKVTSLSDFMTLLLTEIQGAREVEDPSVAPRYFAEMCINPT